jgi:DNA-binding NtrC family response regulator
LLQATGTLLRVNGYEVDTATSGEEAIRRVRANPDRYTLAILDFRMQGKDGGDTAQSIRSISRHLYILIYSGDESRHAVKSSWQAGAVGFVEKSSAPDVLLATIKQWCRKHEELIATLDPYQSEAPGGDTIEELNMVGRSNALKEAARRVTRYRNAPQNVLITGETGTGKELVARALHDAAKGSFVAVNCAAYRGSTDLLESELFGYERGAFTGADREKKGLFETSQGGTVFLDEVHHLSLTAQAKLLRVTQDKKIRRVGGAGEYPVNFRLIAAAKADLEDRCEQGEFLRDLYHRLGVLSIHLPPLRNRTEDIEPLVGFFCRRFHEMTGHRRTLRLQTIRYLERYSWPGNVRELENVVFQLLTDSNEESVGPENLDGRFFFAAESAPKSNYPELKRQQEKEERDLIQNILASTKSKSQAADRLGLSPTTLHSIMKRLGMYEPNETGKLPI